MSRPRWLVVAAVVLAGMVLAVPAALRRMSFFRVRQVELIGVRYLAPDSVLAGLALTPTQNVFDDLDAIAERAEALAGVVSARVERKLPGTLRVTLIERVPVAFAPGPERMVALDGEARPLPYDPAATGLDLPIIGRPDSLLARTLSVIRLTDSTLFREVEEARRLPGRTVRLDLAGAARVLLDGVPDPEDILAIGAVRRHLADAGRRYRELDARYAGWIVVRRSVS